MQFPEQVSNLKVRMPAVYVTARKALAECQKIDECKDWGDKAKALAAYAKQSDDKTLMNMAMRIRARAVRRSGELLEQWKTGPKGGAPKKNNGGGTSPVISQRQAAEGAGLSKDQEKQAKRVANVPEQDFEAAVESDAPPTVAELAEKGKEEKPAERPEGFGEATRFGGQMRKLAEFCDKHDPKYVLGGFLPHEIEETRHHAKVVRDWLDLFLT